MSLIKSFKLYCISETLSPLTHMGGVSGNESILNYEKIVYKNNIRSIPILSGNSIRHRMIREPGAMTIIKNCELEGKLTLEQANYFLNGGNLTESSTTENLSKIKKMQEILPFIRLVGGSLRNQVISGSLNVLRGILFCEENRETINKILPDEYKIDDILMTSEEFINQYQYTRGDAGKRNDSSKIIKDVNEDKEKKINLMIYNGQSVITGAMFLHGFILQNISELEIGSLFHSLKIWDDTNKTIGGFSRIGHGQLKINLISEFEQNKINELILNYKNHLKENKQNIIDWINDTFPEKK
jgi:hypothetical protein